MAITATTQRRYLAHSPTLGYLSSAYGSICWIGHDSHAILVEGTTPDEALLIGERTAAGHVDWPDDVVAIVFKTGHRGQPLWKREHPRADVPDLIARDPDLIDTSWHNDVCPSYMRAGDDNHGGDRMCPRLWVDYADPADREYPDGEYRYGVQTTEDGGWYFQTNDPAEALRAFKALPRED